MLGLMGLTALCLGEATYTSDMWVGLHPILHGALVYTKAASKKIKSIKVQPLLASKIGDFNQHRLPMPCRCPEWWMLLVTCLS